MATSHGLPQSQVAGTRRAEQHVDAVVQSQSKHDCRNRHERASLPQPDTTEHRLGFMGDVHFKISQRTLVREQRLA